MADDFSSNLLFKKVIRFWWILVGLMIIGGLTGLLITRLMKPVYESKAIITSALDFVFLGKLDDWEEDQLYLAIGDIIGSTSVKDAVKSQASANDLQITDEFLEKNFSLDRQDTRWVLRVRAEDPKTARQLNQYWTTAAMDALLQMKEKSATSLIIQESLYALADCFEQSVVVEPVSTSCNIENLSEIRSEIDQINSDLEVQSYRSELIVSHASFELTTEPSKNPNPVLYSRNILVLAGALIGLLAGITLFLCGWPMGKKGQ